MRRRFINSKAVGCWAAAAVFAAGVACSISACVLTSEAEPVEIRHFRSERAELRRSRVLPANTTSTELRMGRVSSGSKLRERIAYRDATYELGNCDDLRWTERPEIHVRRALGRSHGFHRALGGVAPTVDVEVIAFDDLRLGTSRAARVKLIAVPDANDGGLFDGTLLTNRPVVGDAPAIENVVAAMALVLDASAEETTLDVQKALAGRQLALALDSTP